jgi:hypothetical protein
LSVFLSDLTNNISVIALRRISGELKDVWVTNDPADEMLNSKKHGSPDETFEFRLWNGTSVKV